MSHRQNDLRRFLRYFQRVGATTLLGALLPLPAGRAADDPLPLPAPLPVVRHPGDTPPTDAQIALGRSLFADPRLSRTGKIACATCHDPARDFADGRRLARGVEDRPGRRNTPSLWNVAFSQRFFWDGRVDTLEAQALEPIRNPREMDLSLDELVRRLDRDPADRQRFRQAFGGPATPERVARALAAYERTLVVRDTPFDRYLAGDKSALTPDALRGMKLFYGQARCIRCHSGPNLSDDAFHNVGTHATDPTGDRGRREVTGRPEDDGAFRTPSLRNVARTAPYMHDGRFRTLEDVVTHYNFGAVTDAPNPRRDERLEVLYLGEPETRDLVRFLEQGLTGPKPEAQD